MSVPLDLVGFCKAIMARWPEDGIDTETVQDLAVKHGLLVPEVRHTFCNTDDEASLGRPFCSCREYCDDLDLKHGITCYRRVTIQ